MFAVAIIGNALSSSGNSSVFDSLIRGADNIVRYLLINRTIRLLRCNLEGFDQGLVLLTEETDLLLLRHDDLALLLDLLLVQDFLIVGKE